MKRMTGKARMLMEGAVLGTGMTGAALYLLAAGQARGLGLLAIVVLAGLSGVAGWMLGAQMRVKLERDRIWMQGYKTGRTESMEEVREIRIGIISRG